MLKIILESRHYALIDAKNGSALTVALQHNSFESIDIINSGDYDFDYQMQDANGQSFLGDLAKKMLDSKDEDSLEFEKLYNFS